jgi:heterodisulfide reductase subunit D
MSTTSVGRFMGDAAAEIAAACTSCGKCVEVCPVAPHAGLADADPALVVGGVLDVLRRGGELDGHSAAWAHQCDGCGRCIPACPEGINPRTMLMLANSASAETHTSTPQLFRKMARAIRLMAAMQLGPADMARLLQPPRTRDVPVIFYVGCNAVRTPHLLFNAMYVLDALDVDYEVLGGPSSCCGIIHTKWEGEAEAGSRVTDGTLRRFGDFQPDRVLSWCPSCQLHLGETLNGYRETAFAFDHVTKFMVEHEARLRGQYSTAVNMRVLLHAHEGMADLGENVARLLGAVPGLEIAGIAWESGYTCGGSGADRSPGLKAERRQATLDRAMRPGIDALVSLYHGCHIQLAATAEKGGPPVLNFTDILVRALGGTPREDALEGWRMAGDWQALVAQTTPMLRQNGIDIDPNWLAQMLPDVFAAKEFSGGLEAFGSERAETV